MKLHNKSGIYYTLVTLPGHFGVVTCSLCVQVSFSFIAVRLEPRVFCALSRHPTTKLCGKKGISHSEERR